MMRPVRVSSSIAGPTTTSAGGFFNVRQVPTPGRGPVVTGSAPRSGANLKGSWQQTSSLAASHTIPWSSGFTNGATPAAGDLLLIWVFQNADGTFLTAPSGFTSVGLVPMSDIWGTASGANAAVFWKAADGTETFTTVSGAQFGYNYGQCIGAMIISGANIYSPFQLASGNVYVSQTSGNTSAYPATYTTLTFTPSIADGLAIHMFMAETNNLGGASVTFTNSTTGTTVYNRASGASASGNGDIGGVFAVEHVSATSAMETRSVTITAPTAGSSGSYVVQSLHIKPAPVIVQGSAALSASATLWAPVASIRGYASTSNGNPAPSGVDTPASVTRANFTTPPLAGDLLVAVISVDDHYFSFDNGLPYLTALTSGISWTYTSSGGQALDNSSQTYIYTARATGTSADDMSIVGAGEGSEHSVILSIVAVANAGTASYSDGGTAIGSVNNLLIGGTANGGLGNTSYPYKYLSTATASTSGFSLGQTLGYGLQSTATTAGSVDGTYISIPYVYTVNGASALSGSATLAADGTVISTAPNTATLSASSSLTATGTIIAPGSATLTSTTTLTAAATRIQTESATLTSSATLIADANVIKSLASALTSSATLTATGTILSGATASLTLSATLTAAGNIYVQGSSVLIGSGSLSGSATLTKISAAALSTTATVQATAFLIDLASASLSATLIVGALSSILTTRGSMSPTTPERPAMASGNKTTPVMAAATRNGSSMANANK